MKRAWHPEELVEHWSVLPEDWPLIEPKQHVTRLGFTVLLKFFQDTGSFPRASQDVPLTVVDHLAQQVGVPGVIRGKCSVRKRVTKSPSLARHNYILKNNMFCCI